MNSTNINVAKQFSRYPAGRFIGDGPYSGETFRNDFLEPAIKKGHTITVELDGTRGYGSSFLEEAFGGLIRKGYSKEAVLSIQIVTSDESLKDEITEYINNACL